jgi:DNA-directed RNA polymerase specialized sigma24 family protein
LLAWLRACCGTTANLLRHYRGAAKREVNREVPLDGDRAADPADGTLVSPTPSPCEELIRRESETSLGQALSGLPEEYREVLRLRFGEQLHYPEIGERRVITANATRDFMRACNAWDGWSRGRRPGLEPDGRIPGDSACPVRGTRLRRESVGEW